MKHLAVFLIIVMLCLCGASTGLSQTPGGSDKPHLVIIMAEGEYQTDQTLPPFAKANLSQDFRLTQLFADKTDPNHIPGLEALKTADVVLLSMRRRTLPTNQLALIREYIGQGKPLVAMRTSSHAFCLRDAAPAPGHDQWPDFDRQILGCHYQGHHGNAVPTFVRVVPQASGHPILRGVTHTEFRVFGSLYQSLPLADSTQLLMMGRAADVKPEEPVAWTNQTSYGGRLFYTSLGHPQDFTLPDFVQLLRNGIFWAAGMTVPATPATVLQHVPQR